MGRDTAGAREAVEEATRKALSGLEHEHSSDASCAKIKAPINNNNKST